MVTIKQTQQILFDAKHGSYKYIVLYLTVYQVLAMQGLHHYHTCKYKQIHAKLIMKECYMQCGVLKSNEDMILALAGQFKQLSHEPEKFR